MFRTRRVRLVHLDLNLLVTFDALLEEYMSGAMHLARARHIMEAADPVNTLPAPEPAVRTIVKDEEEFTEQQQ